VIHDYSHLPLWVQIFCAIGNTIAAGLTLAAVTIGIKALRMGRR
jgi:hypothetical protein